MGSRGFDRAFKSCYPLRPFACQFSTGHVGENWVRHPQRRERNKHLSRSQERPGFCQAITCFREAGCEVALHYYRTIATAAVSADGDAQATTPYQMIPSADCEAGR
jgi:hypothetical protein